MHTLFTNPDEFFEEHTPDLSVAYPVGIVLLVGIAQAIASVPVLEATVRALPEDASAFSSVVYASGIVGGFLGAIVMWLLYTGAFHLFSGVLYDGKGRFLDTLAVTGWGFVPALFAGLVSAIAAFVVFGNATFPASPDPQQVQALVRELKNRPEFLLASLLGLVFLLWQAFLWAFGIKHARDISLREAGITVGIPVAIALLFRLYGVVT